MQAVKLLCLEIKPLLSNVFNVTIISACRNSIFLDLFPNVYSEGWGDGDGGDNGDDGDDDDDDDGDDAGHGGDGQRGKQISCRRPPSAKMHLLLTKDQDLNIHIFHHY